MALRYRPCRGVPGLTCQHNLSAIWPTFGDGTKSDDLSFLGGPTLTGRLQQPYFDFTQITLTAHRRA